MQAIIASNPELTRLKPGGLTRGWVLFRLKRWCELEIDLGFVNYNAKAYGLFFLGTGNPCPAYPPPTPPLLFLERMCKPQERMREPWWPSRTGNNRTRGRPVVEELKSSFFRWVSLPHSSTPLCARARATPGGLRPPVRSGGEGDSWHLSPRGEPPVPICLRPTHKR